MIQFSRQVSLPPLDLPLPVIAVILRMMARQTVTVRERRRLSIIHRLCSSPSSRVSRDLGHTARTVRRWLQRAKHMSMVLSERPVLPPGHGLEKIIAATIADAPRCGAPLTYEAEEQCGLIALALRKPSEFGLPVEVWTHRELAEVADREGIAKDVSRRTVTRILNECDLRPHRSKYWENPKIDDQEAFEQTVRSICNAYRDAPERLLNGGHTVCIDEKTGIQALERIHPDKPALPGRPALLEFEYIRHGTQTLIASFEAGNGKVLHAHVGDARTEQDLVSLVEDTVDIDPKGDWLFIADRLNTHMSEGLVRLVNKRLGLRSDLGKKGRNGILHNLKSREEFLSDSRHRIRFIYTPRHCSWLNQIEIWFSILSRKALRRASFASKEQLKERILKFIEYFNRTMARAFKWTYTGKVLQA